MDESKPVLGHDIVDHAARAIRADQTGRAFAAAVAAGQRRVMGDRDALSRRIGLTDARRVEHGAGVDAIAQARGVRPPLTGGLAGLAGYALGIGSALIGPRAAMAVAAEADQARRHPAAPEMDDGLAEALTRSAAPPVTLALPGSEQSVEAAGFAVRGPASVRWLARGLMALGRVV